ncbi:MAG: helix-turn-helix transcriptional regulator [Planctomycetaceae bacterium]|nr:helix-turn-helix transcriptional regulator [Planctomycetaceae bacterium]
MHLTREQNDLELLRLIQKLQPATVPGLCVGLGVTATAIRQRLLRFQADGLITRRTERLDRGRPRNTYELTREGLKLLGDDHAEIASILWREIMAIESPAVRKQLLAGIKRALVERFGTRTIEGGLVGRLQRLCTSLVEHGFDVELAESAVPGSLPILRENNCPYHELVAEDASFCELEQSVFSELLGVPVELSTCRLDGHRCCEFHVASASAPAV